MGVSGLTTFIQDNPHLLQDFRLHDTKVIIDGFNLCYYLHARSKLDWVHGGNYDEFGKHVSEFFHTLGKCNVEAVIILDGAHDISGRKLETINSKGKKRLNLVQSYGHLTEEILPQLAITVFKSVLDVLEVQVYCSEYEADEYIAAFAKHSKCPVLSTDSDFYLFDIPAGFVPLNCLNLDTLEEENGTFRLSCSIYYLESLLSHFPGIQKEGFFALFGTVMGNDYIQDSDFNNFFESIKLSPQIAEGFHCTKEQQIRMVTLLQWLQNKSFNEAIPKIQTHLAIDKCEKIESLIRGTFDGYTHCCKLVKLGLLGQSETVKHSRLASLRENTIPTWFIEEYHCANLCSFVGNVLATRKVFLMCHVEDLNSPSAYDGSLPIRKAMYRILLCPDPDSVCIIEEYNRNYSGKKSKKIKVRIKCKKIKVRFSETTPTLSQIPSITMDDKLDFFLKVLLCHRDWLNLFPSGWRLLMACVQFVVQFTTPWLTDEFISSVLLSCLLLSTEDCLQDTCRTLKLRIDEGCVENARLNLREYFERPEHDAENAFVIKMVHSYNQIQSCVLHASYLNALLQKPLDPIKVHLLLNGSFIYNMTFNLENSDNPDSYISEALGKGTGLDRLYSDLKKHLMNPVIVEPQAQITTEANETETTETYPYNFNLLNLDQSG